MDNKNNIEEWVAKRNFEELSEAEKAIAVEALDSEEAYSDIRKIVISFQADDDVAPPTAVHQNIMDAFDAHNRDEQTKIVPITAPKQKGSRKILAYALLAASVLIAVFLILPQKNHIKEQIAENKSEKVLNSDSVLPEKNFEKEAETSVDSEDVSQEKITTTESEKPASKDYRSLEADNLETNQPHTASNNAQSYSKKADEINLGSQKNETDAVELTEMELEDVAKIAAPPSPVQEMMISQETETVREQKTVNTYRNLSKQKNTSQFNFKIDELNSIHYTSY